MSLAAIFFLTLALGYGWYLQADDATRAELSQLEMVLLIGSSGFFTLGWLALLLAEFGRFHLSLLSMMMLVIAILLIARQRHRLQITSNTNHKNLAAGVGFLILLAAYIAMIGSPFEYVVGGRDHGVYVNTGIQIARSGGIFFKDAAILEVPAASRAALTNPEVRLYTAGFPGTWSEGQHLVGLTIRDVDQGVYAPHAFHLYAALFAVFFAAGGVFATFWVTPILALIGWAAIYAVARRVFGWQIGLLTLLLLTASVTQLWFAQYPSAEILIQALFWTALLLFLIAYRTQHWLAWLLCGAFFGLTHLAKLDTVFIVLTVNGAFFWLWATGRLQRNALVGFAIYWLLGIHALVHAFYISTIYFVDHLVRVLLPGFLERRVAAAADGITYPAEIMGRLLAQNGGLIIGLVLAGAICLLALVRFRTLVGSLLHWVERHSSRLRIGLSILLIVWAFLIYFGGNSELYPQALQEGYRVGFLMRLYLSRFGLLFGCIGLIVSLFYMHTRAQMFVWLMLFGNTFYFFVLGNGTAPDHFWVVRRLVPIMLPFFLLLVALLFWALCERLSNRWLQIGFLLPVMALMLYGLGQHTFRLMGAEDYTGLSVSLDRLAGKFSAEDVLLVTWPDVAARLMLPMWTMHDIQPYPIRAEALQDPALAEAVDAWIGNGRTVYWLTKPGEILPTWKGYEFTRQSAYLVDVPLVERSLDHIPREQIRYQVEFEIVKIQQNP